MIGRWIGSAAVALLVATGLAVLVAAVLDRLGRSSWNRPGHPEPQPQPAYVELVAWEARQEP